MDSRSVRVCTSLCSPEGTFLDYSEADWTHPWRPAVGDVIYLKREYHPKSRTTCSSGDAHGWEVTKCTWNQMTSGLVKFGIHLKPLLSATKESP